MIFAPVVLALASLLYPPVFQLALGSALKVEAWRHGASVDFARIEGSFFSPVTLHRSLWTFGSETDAITRLEVARTEAQLDWRSLFGRSSAPWFQRLSVRGVTGKVFLARAQTGEESSKARRVFDWRPSFGGCAPLQGKNTFARH